MGGVEITNLTRRPVPRFAYTAVAEEVLSPRWDISLVFVGPAKARALNQQLRNKEYVPNVLSYIAGEKSGEIVICLAEAKKQAPDFGMTERQFVLYLFIHGLLHIKGWAHGVTMEKREQKLLAKFAKSSVRPLSNDTTHNNRNRHRHLPGEDGRRRGARC